MQTPWQVPCPEDLARPAVADTTACWSFTAFFSPRGSHLLHAWHSCRFTHNYLAPSTTELCSEVTAVLTQSPLLSVNGARATWKPGQGRRWEHRHSPALKGFFLPEADSDKQIIH